MTTTRTTTMLAVATVLAAVTVTPALARDGAHKRTHRHHMVSGERAYRDSDHRRVYVRTAGRVAADPLDFFILNGNQPYFDGYNGQPGYMGYYGHGRMPGPAYILR